MATSFNVFYLGTQAYMDLTEGNTISENAQALVGLTVGDATTPLYTQIQSFAPAGHGYGTFNPSTYNADNSMACDQFSIDSGAPQTYDSLTVYLATITYTDGLTEEISAVVFQDIDGETYIAPEITDNTDNIKMTAKPIMSVTLTAVLNDTDGELYFTRQPGDFMVCFGRGTDIATPQGPRKIETLARGDLVVTLDNGARPIRWIGRQHHFFPPRDTALVRIEPGALGHQKPTHRLAVSRQHRLLVRSPVAARMFGSDEVLVAAHRMIGAPGISIDPRQIFVEYWHILCDRHEVLLANGIPAESLLMGPEAHKMLGRTAQREIAALDPALLVAPARPARPVPSNKEQKKLLRRILKNRKSLLEPPKLSKRAPWSPFPGHPGAFGVRNRTLGSFGSARNSITSKWCRSG